MVAGRGSVGGAAGEAGAEYRRAVAAYLVASGAAGAPVAGLGVPMDKAVVRAVGLETDNAVDDVSVSFDGTWTALIQAKRRLDGGSTLTKAAAQWVAAVRNGLDPANTRLVIASGHLSGPMRALRDLFEREKLEEPGADTKADQSIRRKLRAKLGGVTDEEFGLVLKAAVIWELQVERPAEPGAQVAMGLLRLILQDPSHATTTWGLTLQEAGRVARLRGGNSIDTWLLELRGAGAKFKEHSESPAGLFELRESALDRYRVSVVRRGSEIDLRALGATLSNVSLDEADAGVRVERSVEGHTLGRPLTWAFLRRVRCVLTGLPGAGKSTAIRRVAADLCAGGRLPLPLVASLREVNALDHAAGFRDRVLAIALKDCTAADREILRREFESRLDEGRPVAILLDALDETYEDRAAVVSSIEQFAEGLDPGVCILLSSRDVAYAYAETLGWPHVKLMPPVNSIATIRAILRLAAPARDGVSAGEWVEERRRWVEDVLASDSILRETPLVVVLLTLLAARADVQALPHRRADVLRQAVDEVVQRRELRRHDGRPIGRLEGSALPIAGLRAFAVEARTIMDGKGAASFDTLVSVVGEELGSFWGLAPGEAQAAATDAIRLFDESGIFTIGAPANEVTPRIVLFAEIGDALDAIANPPTMSAWISARVADESLEAVVLACALEPAAGAATVDELRTNRSNVKLARALVRAIREGADMPESAKLDVLISLVDALGLGTEESWECWDDILEMSPPAEMHSKIVEAARTHSEHHALVAETMLVLRFAEPSPEDHLDKVRELVTLSGLPASSGGRGQKSRDFFSFLTPAKSLAEAQEQAAGFLLEHSPENVDLLVQRIMHGPSMLADPLTEVLVAHGFDEEVRELAEARTNEAGEERIRAWLNEHEDAREIETIEQIAESERAAVVGREAVALDAFAALLQSLRLEDYGDAFHKQSADDRASVLTAVAELLSLNMSEIAAEAAILLERMGERKDLGPYEAMFDPPAPTLTPDWTHVHDAQSAVRALLSQFWLTTSQAQVAARFLWKTPEADFAAPLLRDLIPKLHSSPMHERLAALTLASLPGQPEPASWLVDDDPVLRAAAAAMTDFDQHRVDPRLAQLVDDPDGHVQEQAIETLARINPPDARNLLEAVVDRADPGWQCLSCRTDNPAGSRECGKPGCFRTPPRPSNRAREQLSQLP